jgi:hypothetical protein
MLKGFFQSPRFCTSISSLFILFLLCVAISTEVFAKKRKGTIQGKEEVRFLQDCDKVIKYQGKDFSLKLNILNKVEIGGQMGEEAVREASQVTQTLEYENRRLCEDWNNFRVTLEEYNLKSDWISKSLSTYALTLGSISLKDLQNNPEAQRQLLEDINKWRGDVNTGREKLDKKLEEIKGLIEERTDLIRSDIRELRLMLAGNVSIEAFVPKMGELIGGRGKGVRVSLEKLPDEIPKDLKSRMQYDAKNNSSHLRGHYPRRKKNNSWLYPMRVHGRKPLRPSIILPDLPQESPLNATLPQPTTSLSLVKRGPTRACS